MKEHGFTLIELLAVIIILAIVALIATPIILDVVEDARKSAGLSEANMIYSGITNYCATEDIKYQMDSNYTKICTSDMNVDDVVMMVNLGNAEILEIQYSNKLLWLKVKSNGYTYSLQNNVMVEEDLDKPESKYTVGDLLQIQVNDNETQNIYVLEVNGDEIVGILDRNLGNTAEWINFDDYNANGGNSSSDDEATFNKNLYEIGPVTANKILDESTKDWNKIITAYMPTATDILKLTDFYKNLEEIGDTENWEKKYFTEFSALMVKVSSNCQAAVATCQQAIIANDGGQYLLPEWLTINLLSTGDNNGGYGYWTSTPLNYDDTQFHLDAWVIHVYGYLFNGNITNSTYAGIRPIICINESNVIEN